jgi:hypothetical protein
VQIVLLLDRLSARRGRRQSARKPPTTAPHDPGGDARDLANAPAQCAVREGFASDAWHIACFADA